MEIIKLIKDVEQKGIKLWADGDKLKFKAPSGIVDNEIRSKLKDNKGKLCSLMDNDVTGINESNWLYKNFNIIPIIIPKRYKSKDFAELVYNNSLKQLKSIIKKGIKYIYNYDKRQRNKDSGNLQYDETMPY